MSTPTQVTSVVMPWEREGVIGDDAAVVSSFEKLLGSDEEQPEQNESEGDELEGEEPESSEEDNSDAEAEGDESTGDEESDEGDEDEGDDEPTVYTVKVDGKEQEVSLDELLQGYSRTSDYTRKTQEVSAQRKAIETEAAQVRQQRDQYIANLELVESILTELSPTPDWDKLRAENPEKFAAEFAAHQLREAELAKVRQEREREEAERNKEFEAQRKAYLLQEREKLLEAIPVFKDKVKGAEHAKNVAEYAKSLGYTDEDLGSVGDHRIMVILDKAMRFDALSKRKTDIREKVKGKKIPLKPGSRQITDGKKTNKRKEIARRRTKLAQSGDVRDAASVFEMFLDD